MKIYRINNLMINMKMMACRSMPPRLGHPSLDAMIMPIEDVRPFTALKRKGEAMSRNSNPAMIETIHLSLEV